MTQSAFAAAELAGKYKRLIGFLVQRGQAASPNAAGIAHIWNPLARFGRMSWELHTSGCWMRISPVSFLWFS